MQSRPTIQQGRGEATTGPESPKRTEAPGTEVVGKKAKLQK